MLNAFIRSGLSTRCQFICSGLSKGVNAQLTPQSHLYLWQ